MGSIKVLWSPNQSDKFITLGTDLRLYKIANAPMSASNISQAITLSPKTTAVLNSSFSANLLMKCITWLPIAEPSDMLAIGQANGRIVLISRQSPNDPLEIWGSEIVPKNARACNSLSWEPTDSMLAAGFEKMRNDFGITIWQYTSPKRKLISELGNNETCHSLQWLSSKTLISGINNKALKIYDIKDPSKPISCLTKAVYEIAVDPNNNQRVASCAENQIFIWDIRNFEKPVATLTEQKPISMISWCPTRNNLLSCLCKESSVVRLFDVNQFSSNINESEPTVIVRNIEPLGNQTSSLLSSYSWHPVDENRLLAVSKSSEFIDYTVLDRLTLNCSPNSTIVWSQSRNNIFYSNYKEDFNSEIDDISIKMKDRAILGYGLSSQNSAQLVADEPRLVTMWTWIDRSKLEGNKANRFEGILNAVQTDEASTYHLSEKYPRYSNTSRKLALELCGWGGYDNQTSFNLLIDNLCQEKQYSRAAAFLCFNFELRKAIKTLKLGASNVEEETNLELIGMALSGYQSEGNPLWKEVCSSLRLSLKDPYVRAMFAFLTAEPSSGYQDLLKEKDICIQDKISFACLFLPDTSLKQYLRNLMDQMIEQGNLEAILLTGLSEDGLNLLQQYLNITGDVQTVSATILHTIPSTDDPRAKIWVESYRQLLDNWELWNHRTSFDILWCRWNTGYQPQQQVFVSCTYCGESVSNYIKLFNSSQKSLSHQLVLQAASKAKLTCCPSCGKAMPRCSLCLNHLGASTGLFSARNSEGKYLDSNPKDKLARFTNWFAWCQTCRHGGHTNHLVHWFKQHSECPVTSCNCKCNSIDPHASKLQEETKYYD